MGSVSSDDWDRLRRRVYKRDDWVCQCCGRKGNRNGSAQLHAHHIIERSKGGSDDLSNLITLCDRCHSEYHDNPYLLEEGPPVTPSYLTRLKDWLAIDVVGIRGSESRTTLREKPKESEERIKWREQGLEALSNLADEIEDTNDVGSSATRSHNSPPRLYTSKEGGVLLGISDEALTDLFGGCPECGQDSLRADWIQWKHRRKGTAKRIRCCYCNRIFAERRVERFGRPLITLNNVDSEFELPFIGAPLRYQLTKPDLCLEEFDTNFDVDCSACGTTESLRYGWRWRRTEVIPRREWRCEECEEGFSEVGDSALESVTEPISEIETSPGWFYAILITILIAGAWIFIDPLMTLISGTIIAPTVYKDLEYVRCHADNPPSTRLWTWTTLCLSVFGGIAYLANRKRKDTTTSKLHSRSLRNRLSRFLS